MYACNSVTREGEKYWQDRCPDQTGDLCLWPKGFIFVVKFVCLPLTHTYTLPHFLCCILVYHTCYFFLSVSVGWLVSTGSLSCARSRPSLFIRSRIFCPPPQGKLVYFCAGLTRFKPHCAIYSFSTLLLPFPHIYLMAPYEETGRM